MSRRVSDGWMRRAPLVLAQATAGLTGLGLAALTLAVPVSAQPAPAGAEGVTDCGRAASQPA